MPALVDASWPIATRPCAGTPLSLLGRIGKPAALPAEAALRKAAREDAHPLARDAARRALE